MFLESSSPVCAYPWYLPAGLTPDGLLAAACKSPEALTTYVVQNLDQPDLFRFLAESFTRIPSHDSFTTKAVFNPLVNATSVEERRAEAPMALELLNQRIGFGRPGVVYSISDDDVSWSISWPHVLLSLDELLAAPNPVSVNDPLIEPEDLHPILHNQYVGWLGVLLLPTLRIYDPCAYECAVTRLYATFINNIPLLSKAHFRHLFNPAHITRETFTPLRERHFEIFRFTQPGLVEALRHAGADYAKKMLASTDTLCSFDTPNSSMGESLFNACIRSQLLLTVPSLRSIPNDNVPVSKFIDAHSVGIDVLQCKLRDPGILTGFVPSTVNTLDEYSDTEKDLNPRLRYLAVFQLITETSAISLMRNSRFLNHIYAQLSMVFGYESADSINLRDNLVSLFSGWCELRSGDYSNILAIIDASSSQIPSSDYGNKDKEYLARLMFSVSLKRLFSTSKSATSSTSLLSYTEGSVQRSLDLVDTSHLVLYSSVWTDALDMPCTSEYSTVLMNPEYPRNSNLYFQAYTASLALTMRGWLITARKSTRGFNSFNPDQFNLIYLLQYIGVLYSLVAGEIQLTINVPRYVHFLTRLSHVSSSISSGIRSMTSEYPSKRSPARMLTPTDSEYRNRFHYLTYLVVKKLVLSSRVTEVPTANLRDSFFPKFEAKSHYFSDDSIRLDSWLFGVPLAELSREFVNRFKYRPLSKKKSDTTSPKPRSGKSSAHKKLLMVTRTFSNKWDSYPLEIKVLRLDDGKTLFGLPWKRLHDLFNVLPPSPKSVYKKAPKVSNNSGMYVAFYESIKKVDDAPDDYAPSESTQGEYVQSDVPGGLDHERNHLVPSIRVFVNTPYMFTLEGLACDNITGSSQENCLTLVPQLRQTLEALKATPIHELREMVDKPPQKKKEKPQRYFDNEIEKREKCKQRLATGASWSPKDPRVRFTPDEDRILCEFYRPGMTQEIREKILHFCSGHSWEVITIHAKALCKKMLDAGVTDPTKLPYIRATPDIKKLLKEMGE